MRQIDGNPPVGETALVLADSQGDSQGCGSLIKHGADFNATLEGRVLRGATALMMASKHGHLSTVKALLRVHAHVDAVRPLPSIHS